ncbi:hypothetical protein, partial [Hymenobacter jeollabukensis]
WVRPLGRRWAVAAGADVGAGYRREYRYRLTFNTGDTGIRDQNGNPVPVYEESRNTFTTHSLFVRPFASLRFYYTAWLYISSETSITGSYAKLRIDTESKRVRLDTNEAFVRSYSDPLTIDYSYELRLQLLRQVTVHYCFGR